MKVLNDQEILEALLAGKKLRGSNWRPGEYLHLVGGVIRSNNGDLYGIGTNLGYCNRLYEEPTPPKLKITAKDVGRIAVFEEEGKREELITGFYSDDIYPVKFGLGSRKADGTQESHHSIIRIRDVGEE